MLWPLVSMVGAATSAVLHLRAAVALRPFDGSRGYRTFHLYATAMSAFYTAAFAVLIFTNTDRATWSTLLTPASAITFFTIWSLPAVMHREDIRRVGGVDPP